MTKSPQIKGGGEQGFVLVVCLILLLMLSLIGIASITSSTSDMKVSGNELKQTGAFYSAEAGLEKATASIMNSYRTTGNPPSPLPGGAVSEYGYQNDYTTVSNGAAVQGTLIDGAYKGLYGSIRSFTIRSNGYDPLHESQAKLSLVVQDALVPLFQFAVFYQNDLEIAPGPAMTLGGRVHSNSNVYLMSENVVNIDSYITSAGDIFHGRKPGSGQSTSNGDVFIKDKNGVYQNMESTDGSWLDSQNSNWVNGSIARWGGLVEDSNHGITPLEMPVVVDGPATDLIDRASGNADSYENKAGLKFVDGQAYYLQSDGTWRNVTSNLTTSGAMVNATFRDAREGTNVNSIDIDIVKLNTSGYFPTNGIIYGSIPTAAGSLKAFRIKNGATLPRATTIATNNPLYTVGNYNTTSKKPAAILADAITILSGNWSDAKSTQDLSQRVATATQVNASYMTGNLETGASGQGYNGGLENLPRFLEKWDGVTFTWRGSAVDLWYSRQADGAWSYGNFYTAPNRDWAFDSDLLDLTKLPPGTPMVNIIQKSQWSQDFDGTGATSDSGS
jgi:hypothetical protein